jgi:hypothetical protein
LKLDHTLFRMADGKHLVYSVHKAMQWLLRSLGRHEALNDVDQTCHLDMCSETPYGRRRQVVWKLGVLVGMNKQRRSNQEAQDCAGACALCTRLLGQQRLALDNIERAPGQVDAIRER